MNHHVSWNYSSKGRFGLGCVTATGRALSYSTWNFSHLSSIRHVSEFRKLDLLLLSPCKEKPIILQGWRWGGESGFLVFWPQLCSVGSGGTFVCFPTEAAKLKTVTFCKLLPPLSASLPYAREGFVPLCLPEALFTHRWCETWTLVCFRVSPAFSLSNIVCSQAGSAIYCPGPCHWATCLSVCIQVHLFSLYWDSLGSSHRQVITMLLL